jgi:anti-sigma factor RsiW
MMTCREMLDLLLDFVSGELAEDQAQCIRAHLDNCPPCFVFVNTYRLTIQLARQLPCNPLPPPCEQRLRAAISEQWKQVSGNA